jgi:hypothetical protein
VQFFQSLYPLFVNLSYGNICTELDLLPEDTIVTRRNYDALDYVRKIRSNVGAGFRYKWNTSSIPFEIFLRED